MKDKSRSHFILLATSSYVLLALAWIFLSDHMLMLIVDREKLLALSSVKGVFFVIVTGAMFFWALRAVPSVKSGQSEGVFSALARATTPGKTFKVWMYLFALVSSVAMLMLRHEMPLEYESRPMMILYVLPIMLSALLGGFGPGLLATITVMIGVDILAQPHLHSAGAASYDRFQWAVLMFSGLFLSGVSELLRRSLSRVEHDRGLLNAVVSGSSDVIFVKDSTGRFLLVNEAAATIYNKPVEQLLGTDSTEIYDQASLQMLNLRDQGIMESAEVQTYEEKLTTREGQERIFVVTKGPVFDAQGQVSGLFGIARDVTDAKQAERALREREQRLNRVIEGSDQGYWDWNLQTNIFEVSARWETMLGYEPGEVNVAPEHWSALVHPDDLPMALDSVERHLKGELPLHEIEIRCRTKQGSWSWIFSRGRVVEWDAEGKALMMSGTHTDINERKRHEAVQREAGIVFENSYEGIMVVSPEGLITKVNPAFSRITGYSDEEAVGLPPRILSSGLQDPAFYKALWALIHKNDFWRGEIWNKRKNGEVYAELLSISVVRDSQGKIQYYLGVFSDISQLKAHEAELNQAANFDPLTRLPNRRLLEDRLNQAIVHATRSGKSSAICFLDLDGFKAINDLYGHALGDQLLLGVSENLKAILRADDTLARMGGDEFVLIISDLASQQECMQVLERVLVAASLPVEVDGMTVSVSASIGVSLYPQDNADADTLLRHADQAMYLAKEAGKNRYQLFDPENDRKAQTDRQYLERLRQALQENEFVLFYQPKVDLINGEIIGAEALIRWIHPERGLISPAEFLPYFYGSHLEKDLGEWVIQTGLSQLSVWMNLGLSLKVSVNISANHLLQEGFFEHLSRALKSYPDSPASHFELEVLETAAIGDIQQAVDILKHCKELGVTFSLDDFGTGYSSLTYLRKLPVDVLKIDQSFVRDMLVDTDDLGIVEGVIQLAGVFDRQVIAEGVETMEHGAMLRRLGCRLVQGYGIARPMSADKIPAWCAEWTSKKAWLLLDGSVTPIQ